MTALNLSFSGNFAGEEPKNGEVAVPYSVGGMAVKHGFVKGHNVIIPKKEIPRIALSYKTGGVDGGGIYILKDHGGGGFFTPKSVDTLLGRVTDAEDKDGIVNYKGSIYDKAVAEKIANKLLTASSASLRVNKPLCSICGRDYGDQNCLHQIGKEYAQEPVHDLAKDYLEEMDGKNIASIVLTEVDATEHSVVLFPAIKGANIQGFSFSEDSSKQITDIEKAKDKTQDLVIDATEIVEKLEVLIEGFNKEFNRITYEVNMSEQSAQAEQKIAELTTKITELTTALTDTKAKLDVAEELVNTYKAAEAERKKVELAAKVAKLNELRKARKLAEKDFANVSEDVVNYLIATLEEIPAGVQGQAGGDPAAIALEELRKQKAAVRMEIFRR